MKRVASLYLPSWSIDRLRRAERRHAPPAETDGRAAFAAIGADAAVERASHCSAPKEGGWRPGARWARTDTTEAGSGLADRREDVEAAIEALPRHRRPPQRELGRVSQAADNPFKGDSDKGLSHPREERVAPPAPLRELSRRTEAAENPFRAMPSDEVGLRPRAGLPPLQFPGEDAPAKAGRGAALRDSSRQRYRNEAPHGSLSLQRVAALPPVQFPGEDMATRAAQRGPRRSARDGHGGEAGYIAPPSLGSSLAQLAAMPSVQFPGEGPHPDNHGRSEPTAPTYGQGRFFQTGRTLSSVVARVCGDDEMATALLGAPSAEPPLATVHKVGPRAEIAAVNPAARALGLQPGMALTMARAQVPGLEVRAADPEGDAADLRALAELLARRWSPTVAVSDADGLFIDLTGVAHLHGGEARFARRLVRLLARRGFAARVAVADTAGAAWALARAGGGGLEDGGVVQVVAKGAHAAAIAPLPVAALRLDPAALELLARLGVDSVSQLLAMPRAPLVRRFGRGIADRLDQATGHAPEPLDPVGVAVRVMVEQRFAEPIATAEAIEHWLRALMPRLARALAQVGQGARDVELVAVRVDGVPQRLRVGFARATRDPAHMLRLVVRRIEEIAPGYGIDALALHVRRADPLGSESLAPALAGEARPDLGPLVETLANRIGADKLWRVIPVASDVPERSLAQAPPLDPPADRATALRRDDVRRLDTRPPDHPWHCRWPRPVRLLRRPEAVDHVLVELPDQPPRRFTWRGMAHRVVRADGPERIAGEWWRRDGERQAVRDYFRVEVESGQRFWLYRRGDGVRSVTGDLRWFLHGRVG